MLGCFGGCGEKRDMEDRDVSDFRGERGIGSREHDIRKKQRQRTHGENS